MSQSRNELDCGRLPDNAAYALGALDEGEARVHREHLAQCSICRAELAGLRTVVDSLAIGVAQKRVPEDLRGAIMGTVRSEAERLQAGTRSGSARVTPGRHRWRPRLAPAVATVLAVGVGVVVGALTLGGRAKERTVVLHAVVITPGHHAVAELRRTGSHLELVVVGMPAPPSGRIYEVWLEHGAEAPEPTDVLFSVTKTGNGTVGVPGDLVGVSKVLVTDEPLGGSLKPTREPVIVGSI